MEVCGVLGREDEEVGLEIAGGHAGGVGELVLATGQAGFVGWESHTAHDGMRDNCSNEYDNLGLEEFTRIAK